MTRRVKEFVDIEDHTSLDALIDNLVELRDRLPADAEAELRMRGDDVFGRKLSISFFREQTAEEAAFEERYATAAKDQQERELLRLQEELGVVCMATDERSRLRRAA